MVTVEISYGELFDKISILEIKNEKLKNDKDIKKVTFELNLLYNVIKSSNLNQKK